MTLYFGDHMLHLRCHQRCIRVACLPSAGWVLTCIWRLQALYDTLMAHTDAGVAVGDAVVTFDGVAVLAPRGRFDIELYGSFMKLLGQVRQPAAALITAPVSDRCSARAAPVEDGFSVSRAWKGCGYGFKSKAWKGRAPSQRQLA